MHRRLLELAALFLRLGATGFGGPAALIAMMQDEVVVRRKWLTQEQFLDLVGTTNLIPGPNATEMAMHIGYIRAGPVGLVLAGLSFILPAALLTTGLAWAYVRYGALPHVAPFFYGLKPAVLGVILTALWRLGKASVKGWRFLIIGLAVMGASFLGVHEILALLAGGLVGMFWLRLYAARESQGKKPLAPSCLLAGALLRSRPLGAAFAAYGSMAAAQVTLWKLGLFFLKIGAVLYGSGYVLLAFLERGLVRDYRWMSQQQLLDAIAAGQLTPGPLSSTATFVGYVLLGIPGAVVATAGMFLPSFLFVLALSSLLPRLRRSPWAASFLDAVNVSSIGLMAVVTIRLGQTTLVDWPSWLIALATLAVNLRWKINSTWLVLAGALIGWLLSARLSL